MTTNFALQSNFPRRTDTLHVAVIMDGNGRWAVARGLPRVAGHRAGAGAVRKITEGARECGIKTLTLYAFSSDNWKRPADEIRAIMNLFREHLAGEVRRCLHNGIRLRVIGRRDRLRTSLRHAVARAEHLTAVCAGMDLNLAVDYSSRHAMALQARGVQPGDYLVPDVDLLIRTGGEQRLSDFLLRESAYAELYFTQTPWPDFDMAGFAEALQWFDSRQRRYGSLSCPPGKRAHGIAP